MKTKLNLLTLGILLSLTGASFGQPNITTQPQDQTNAVGTTATLWVEATNSAPLAYQWQKFVTPNWSELMSRTNTALILTNVQASDAADYRIVVTNVAGAVTSTVAHLYVIVPPVITSQPVDQAVALGTPASFSVSVAGTAPLSYQWRQDGVDQADATTRSFSRSSAQLTNAGGYAVVVTNLAGAVTSRVARLSVALGRVYTNAQGAQLAYRLFAPVNYDPAKTYPLVLFWHGSGEVGTDNLAQLTDFGQFIFLSASNQAKHPCFYLLPQAPIVECEYFREPGGMFEQAMGLLNLLQVEFNIDPDRLYITGYSLGGFVTWGMVARFPSLFAAAVPTAAGWACTNSAQVPLGSYLNIRVPVWNFHAANDSIVNVQSSDYAVSSLRSVGGNPIYTRYQSGGHGIPQTAYSTPGLVDWVMAQKRGMTSTTPPLVTITTPTAAASYVTALSALDLAGTAAHYTNVLRVAWTNTVNQAGGTATGTNNWSVTGIPLRVAATNLIVITAWATNSTTGFRGDTTFNTALAVVCWPIRATLTLEGTSALLNWTGGGPPYRVQRATDLIVGNWTDFLPDATAPVSLPLDGTTGFYRIIGR